MLRPEETKVNAFSGPFIEFPAHLVEWDGESPVPPHRRRPSRSGNGGRRHAQQAFFRA